MHRPVNFPAKSRSQPYDAASEAEGELDLFDEDAGNDCNDDDPLDLSCTHPEDEGELLRTELSEELLAPLRFEEIMNRNLTSVSGRTATALNNKKQCVLRGKAKRIAEAKAYA